MMADLRSGTNLFFLDSFRRILMLGLLVQLALSSFGLSSQCLGQAKADTIFSASAILDQRGASLYGILLHEDQITNNFVSILDHLFQDSIPEEELLNLLVGVITYPVTKTRFVPEHYIPLTEYAREIDGPSQIEGMELSEAFWEPWLIRYFGDEGVYWHFRAERVGYSPAYADEYLLKGIALGNTDAMYHYAMNDISLGKRDRLSLLLQAADEGNADAQREVGKYFLSGSLLPHDPQKAVTYYEMAMSNPNGVECMALAQIYMEGKGIPQDHKKALVYAYVGSLFNSTIASSFAEKINLSDEEKKNAQQAADEIIAKLQEKIASQEQASMERWNALIPEIKKDIGVRAPWMLWAFIPQAIREPICEQTYQERLAANNGQFPPPPLPDGTVPIPWPLPQ